MNQRTRRNITPREQRFIDLYIETGDATKSATEAGWNPKTAYSRGYQLKQKFRDVIAERVASNFRDKSPRMAKIIEDLAEKSDNDQVRYKAASDYLDRGGYKPTDKYEEVKPKLSHDELVAQIARSMPSVLGTIWPKLTPSEKEQCLIAIGLDPGLLRKAEVQHLKVVGETKPD